MAEDAQGIHISEMVRAFRELGHEVKVVSLVKRGGYEQRGEFSIFGRIKSLVPSIFYEVAEIGYNIYGIVYILFNIYKFKPDFIYERYALYNISGVVAGKYMNIPVILEVNSPLSKEKMQFGKLRFQLLAEKIEKWICSNSQATIAVSTPLKDILMEEGVPGNKIYVIPNGVRKELRNDNQNRNSVRDRLGIPRSAIVFGFVGWFRKWHGLEQLINVATEDEFKNSDVCVLLVGGGPIYKELIELANKYDVLNKKVYFSGPVLHDEVYEYIYAFDVALQPSVTTYASPMKIFEYLLYGKPIIAPVQHNIMEILTDGYNSWLFDPEESSGLKSIMLNIINNISEINRRSLNAIKTIQDREYYWEKNAERTIELLGNR
jgi:glycosyltransferase involved in cell wall biosynthesis